MVVWTRIVGVEMTRDGQIWFYFDGKHHSVGYMVGTGGCLSWAPVRWSCHPLRWGRLQDEHIWDI